MSRPDHDRPPPFRLRAFVRRATALVVIAGAARGQEIAPFRLTDVNGSLSIVGWRDDQTYRQPAAGTGGNAESRTTQTDLRLGLFIDTRSYVYHPNLISLELGGGPILESAQFDADGSSTRANKSLYDLTFRANFLKDKPYRGSVYFQHLNPTLSVAPADSLVTENEKYGFDVALLRPVTPVPARVEAWRSTTRGRSATRIVDDDMQSASLRLDYSFGKDSQAQFSYAHMEQSSASGSPALPIQASNQVTDSADFDAQTRFGADREWLLQTPVNFFQQSYTLSDGQSYRNESLRAAVDLRGTHWEGTLNSFARYDLFKTKDTTSEGTFQAVSGSVAFVPDQTFSGTLGVRGESERRSEVDADRYEVSGSLLYRRPLGAGELSLSYGTLLGKRDQRANAPIAPVEGEQIVLAGTTPVALRRPNVVPGSVRVSNVNRTQVYVETIDYLLDTLGTQTRVQRLPSGSIANGETVLVDYQYDAGGTFAFRQFDNSLSAAWAFGSLLTLNVRYLDSAQTLLSGTPTSPLNSVRDFVASAQSDVPFRYGVEMGAGGMLEWENRRETILSFRRNTLQAYWQTLVPGMEWMSVRAGLRRAQVDYEPEGSTDVDSTAWDISMWASTPWGIILTATYNDMRDTGGFEERRERIATGRATWRFRQLSAALWGSYARESQGSFTRNRSRVDFLVKRDF